MSIHHDQATLLACVSYDLTDNIETDSRPQMQPSKPGIDCAERELISFCFPFANGREDGGRSRSEGLRTGLMFGLPF